MSALVQRSHVWYIYNFLFQSWKWSSIDENTVSTLVEQMDLNTCYKAESCMRDTFSKQYKALNCLLKPKPAGRSLAFWSALQQTEWNCRVQNASSPSPGTGEALAGRDSVQPSRDWSAWPGRRSLMPVRSCWVRGMLWAGSLAQQHRGPTCAEPQPSVGPSVVGYILQAA